MSRVGSLFRIEEVSDRGEGILCLAQEHTKALIRLLPPYLFQLMPKFAFDFRLQMERQEVKQLQESVGLEILPKHSGMSEQ